ncbi:MAG: HU family DNA-binding protein [Alphaproteobacteria bacterium]|nr:HU family DNA-binding protein [Alphaproteobacteria bacterium]
MNRSGLESRVAERSELASSAAKGAVDAVFDVIAEASGEDARISGFGVFGTRPRPACTGRNPRTGGSVSKALKDALLNRKARAQRAVGPYHSFFVSLIVEAYPVG